MHLHGLNIALLGAHSVWFWMVRLQILYQSYQEYLRAQFWDPLLYINDITKDIDSPLHMFADDCLLYRIIESTEDTTKILTYYLNGLIPIATKF